MTTDTHIESVVLDGLVPYADGLSLQQQRCQEIAAGIASNTLYLMQHAAVITMGRETKPMHVLHSKESLAAMGVDLCKADRGGEATYHGPGQLVGYPILDLGPRPDAVGYLRRLEEVVIRAAADAGVKLGRSQVQTGVWSGNRKVCAIGVRLMRARVTLHGFALNCATDLSWYGAIVPCGLADEGVTSVSELTGRDVSVDAMAPLVLRHFQEVFELRLTPAPDPEAGQLQSTTVAAAHA